MRQPDSPYDNIRYVNNVAPDFEDPDWADKVTDWNEFWHNAEWDDDIMELEDEHDVPKEIISDMRLQRAEQLIAALGNLDAKENVVRFLGPVEQHSYTREDPNEFDLPNEKDDPNPDWTPFDFRAMVEKRRKREMLDQVGCSASTAPSPVPPCPAHPCSADRLHHLTPPHAWRSRQQLSSSSSSSTLHCTLRPLLPQRSIKQPLQQAAATADVMTLPGS
jgi:hypothetical protein